jgi:hypothetical protein
MESIYDLIVESLPTGVDLLQAVMRLPLEAVSALLIDVPGWCCSARVCVP